jgi:hypothetical protein
MERAAQAACEAGVLEMRAWIAAASRVPRIFRTVSGSRNTRAIRDNAFK